MSEVTYFITFVLISLLISLILPSLILDVTENPISPENLTGFWGSYADLVNANLTIGAGWFSTEINVVPFASLREFLTDLAIAWSYVPTPIAVTLGITLFAGMFYAVIKLLPTT